MGKKLPPRKLSALSSRRPSIGLSSPDDRTSDMPIHSPIQEEFEPQGYAQGEVPPSYFPNSDFPQALHLWCEEGQLQHPTTKLPHLPLEEDPNPQEESFESPPEPSPGFGRSWAYKNILGVSLSFLFVFTSFQGLQNLQSSINSSGGLGLANLAILYVFFTLFGFFSPGVLEILGTKYSMLVGLTSFLLYTFANFYPSWYLFVPASVLTGMGSALLWSASSSHIVEVAVIIAPKLSKDKDHLISLFTGIFFCFFQLSQIPGNLASSLILFPYGGLNASNISGCTHSTASQEDFDQKYLYVLFSVYSVSVFVGILCCAVMVSPLHKNVPFFSSKRKFEVFFKAPLVDLLKIMKECKMLLLTPAAIFTGLQQAFAFGTFTEAYVGRCFGTHQVGFTIVVLGVTSAIMSVVYGKITKYIPIVCIFFFGGIINIAFLLFLLLWSPVPSYLVIFLFAVFWGIADGVWNTMTASLAGILFPTRSNVVYSGLRIWVAVGLSIGFIIAEVLSVSHRIWFLLIVVLLALASSLGLEIVTRFKLSCYRSYRVNGTSSSI